MIAEFRACDSCSKSDGLFLMAATAKRKRRLWDAYAFAGFRPEGTVRGIFGDPKARIIKLNRRSKKRDAPIAEACTTAGTIVRSGVYAICLAATRAYTLSLRSDASFAKRVAK